MTELCTINRLEVALSGNREEWSVKRRMLDVLRDRHRFLRLLAAIERNPAIAEYRIEEAYGMSLSLARRARRSYDGLQRAGDHLAAETLGDIIRGDFSRATGLFLDLPAEIHDLLNWRASPETHSNTLNTRKEIR